MNYLRKMPERGLFGPVWVEYNRMVDHIREMSVVGGRNIRLTRTLNGSLILAEAVKKGAPGDPGVVKQYRVKEVFDDYLRCREFDGTTEDANDVQVAKPFNLRRTGWHGVSVLYTLETYPGSPGTMTISYDYVSAVYRKATVSSGGGSLIEHQVIRPIYVPDRSVIFATQSENGTGTAQEWIDANFDGRAWARVI